MQYHWSDEQIAHIIDQALVYQCACPAQVGEKIVALRRLYNYQQNCLELTDIDRRVHSCIAEAVAETHARMEACLQDVLELEGWDQQTLSMPPQIKQRALKV